MGQMLIEKIYTYIYALGMCNNEKTYAYLDKFDNETH